MPFKNDKKRSIITSNLENMTPTCISKKSGICKSTVYNFIKKLKETGQLEAYPRTGRPPVSTKREDNMLFRLVKKYPTMSLNQFMLSFFMQGKEQ